jgi:hypothetical protein
VKRPVKAMVAAIALILTLAVTAPVGAQTGAVKWVCTVDGVDVTFVSAPEAALHGITQADSRAGVVFETQFGEENCHVESGP